MYQLCHRGNNEICVTVGTMKYVFLECTLECTAQDTLTLIIEDGNGGGVRIYQTNPLSKTYDSFHIQLEGEILTSLKHRIINDLDSECEGICTTREHSSEGIIAPSQWSKGNTVVHVH